MIYALDSNVISYALRKDKAILDRIAEAARQGNDIIIPPIAYYEVRRWLNVTGATSKERYFNELCGNAVASLDVAALKKAAQIYADLHRKGRPTSDADILIAAFCIVNQCVLVTNNERHFSDIDELKKTNWVES